MARKRSRQPEIDLSTVATDGLEVIEVDPLTPPPASPPLDPLAGLPSPLEAPYAEPVEDPVGTKGIWTAIEHL